MKGKLLFICTDHFDLYRIFEQGFRQYSGCDVTTVLHHNYQLKNRREKVLNSLAKVCLKKNLRKYWGSRKTIAAVAPARRYDHVFVICPELLYPEHLDYLTSRSDRSVAYYWDGFDHFPAYRETIAYFDHCYSFDPVDAAVYGLNFITNFYYYEGRAAACEYDLFFIGSDSGRFPTILKIASLVERLGKRARIYLFSGDRAIAAGNTPPAITFIDEFIPFGAVVELMKKSRIILDVHKDIQRGLSFRVFEAMGLGKKLITTNPDIVNYDFYTPQNIFLWREDTRSIPETFFTEPYQELDETIYRKYSQEHWVKTVLGRGGQDQGYRRET